MQVNGQHYRSVWREGAIVRMIDQRLLPHEFRLLDCATVQATAEAIRVMAVRGAGAIGTAAGLAMAQAALVAPATATLAALEEAARVICATRPTAHDLFFAVDQVLAAARSAASGQAQQAAVAAADAFADGNAQAGEAIGLAGAPLIAHGSRVLTHCNAGWLAFADWGSALAPVYQAKRQGRQATVYTAETRPRSQGAKLTAWELQQEGVPYHVVSDTAVGSLFRRRLIDLVIVGADRIAANGDTANKIGTYTVALLAQHHGVPFYVAAPSSTFDSNTPHGEAIVIEERSEEEVHWVSGLTEAGTLGRVRITPAGAHAVNPAFDVTPAAFIRAFITEYGIIAPDAQALAALAAGRAVAGKREPPASHAGPRLPRARAD